MFDCHYDLLTYLYINENDIEKVKRYLKRIFNKNITGGIFNLFYMSKEEMNKELGIKQINILGDLTKVNELISSNNIIPKGINYIYGIEGLDYLEEIDDIEKIYNLGVKSVNIVWNNDNKFAGGAKGNKNKGLTYLGINLVQKLVDSNIAIDLSHSNEKTFNDITDLCISLKKEGKHPKVFASHSNCKTLCNHQRNLSDEQILKIKELNGIIGIVGVKPFCIKEEKFDNNKAKYENYYIEHIKYLKKLLKEVDNIAVATDDMGYYKTNKKYYKHFNIFNQKKIKNRLKKLLLKNNFTQEEIEKILHINAERFLEIS